MTETQHRPCSDSEAVGGGGGGGGGRAGRKEKKAEAEERKRKATNLEHQAETSWSQSQSTPVISDRHGRQQARAWVPQAFMFPGVVRSHIRQVQLLTYKHQPVTTTSAVRTRPQLSAGLRTTTPPRAECSSPDAFPARRVSMRCHGWGQRSIEASLRLERMGLTVAHLSRSAPRSPRRAKSQQWHSSRSFVPFGLEAAPLSITGHPSPPRPPAAPSSTPDHTQVQAGRVCRDLPEPSFPSIPPGTLPFTGSRIRLERDVLRLPALSSWLNLTRRPWGVCPAVLIQNRPTLLCSSLSLQAVSEMLVLSVSGLLRLRHNVVQPTELPGSLLATLCLSSVDTAGIRKLNSESHFQDQHRSKPPVPASFQKLKTGQVIHNIPSRIRTSRWNMVKETSPATWRSAASVSIKGLAGYDLGKHIHYTSLLALPIAGLDISTCALHLLSGRWEADESRYHPTM
ncbi:hypothetical protein CCHR01_04517 [Colletotrichum chrysophilum]|uniref:Uncharacterized protein n=1 Tax=Colletotrichum chrysophilum TaxID=1836956 RepID=A0AAD9ATE9_9PEZI|nr:hypothetical protein CCHR01_04517 [Colletotrichum chrysophilum]